MTNREPAEVRDLSFLVVGGAGFIGSHLVEVLVHRGGQVTVLDNMSTGKRENLLNAEKDCRLVVGDIRDRTALAGMGKFDIICNLAAVSLIDSFRDPILDLNVNAGGVINLLELTRKTDARMVQVSTGSVYGNPVSLPIDENHPLHPISPYAVSKLAAEFYCGHYVRTYGANVTCLRYFNVYGPRQAVSEERGVIPIFVSRAMTDQSLVIFGDGKQSRDFVYVSDVTNATVLAAANERIAGEVINVGGPGEEVTILELAGLVQKILGKDRPLVFREPKPGDIRRLVADSSKAKALLGYQPRISLPEGLRDYIAYLKSDAGS
jgi:UDP-glucose 4-epimerase